MPLDLAPRLADPDRLFAALVAAHEGLDPAASRRLDAALVLLLANHIGDDGVDVGGAAGADLDACSLQRVGITRADDDACALSGQLLGDRSSKAAACRSDERDATA